MRFIKLVLVAALFVAFVGPGSINSVQAAGLPDPTVMVRLAKNSLVIIYGVNGCGHTQSALKAFPNHVFYDVRQEPSRMQELLMYTDGRKRWPVIIKDGVATVGFGGT